MPARILLADDHALFREALRGLIEARLSEVQIVGEAATGREAIDLCQRHQPDLMVLDLSMPDLGGLDVLAELKGLQLATKVLVVSQYTDRSYVMRALKLGARGYVPKKALAKDLVSAVSAVLEGRTYVDPSLMEFVVDAAVRPHEASESGDLGLLSDRELEILKLVAEGKTAKEIGELLHISPHTVNRHRANLMEKLEVHSKSDLVRAAVRLKLVEP
ncbi:MAG: response regulator transcription factor [Deltaproteobacteria bacterium]|nr:response regulator transcription factor [Deltaproteobacteria bacterium]